MPGKEKGRVQVYTGKGKGKTTAALGLCLRAAGHGLRACVILFMKGGIIYGEVQAARRFNGLLEIIPAGRESFVSRRAPEAEDIRLARQGLVQAREIMTSGRVDILVLDEINVALDFGLVDLSAVLDLIAGKPEDMELVLTGRNAPPEIIAAADLVTEMREIKHYWKKGMPARKGIEH
jgi:cob(I)alamin adenosyltransferase